MKPLFLTIILTALSIFSAYTQKKEVFKSEFYMGVGGGAMSTSIDFMPTVQQSSMKGVHGGISARYISEKHLGLITELNYAQRGWTEEFNAEQDFSYSRTLNYLEIPFMTHVYFGKKSRFIINAGPQISILLNDNAKMSQSLADDVAQRQAADPNARIGYQYSPFSELRRVDYGLIGGAGIELQTGIGAIDLEGRYYFGLGDVFENRRSKNAYFSRSAHRLIEAKLTYYIKIH
ncbi:MAG: PorT family protein [Porphyromonadaceae bacterium]|nr:PorT family protein [Porphyromonadaceae bacterium]